LILYFILCFLGTFEMLLSVFDYLSGNVPGGFSIVILLILITWFVAWYVYYFSGILSKKRFFFWGVGISTLFVIFYSIVWLLFPPPKDKTRILITFSENPSTTESFSKLYSTGFKLYKYLSLNLSNENFLIYHPDWLLELENWEIFAEESFQQKLIEYMEADFTFSIKIAGDSSTVNGIFIDQSTSPDTLLNVRSKFLKSENFANLTKNILGKLEQMSPDQKLVTPNFTNWDSSLWNEWALGRLYYLKEELNSTITHFKKCLMTEPGFAPALLGLAKIELDSAKIKKANGSFFQDHLALTNSYLFKIKNKNSLDAEAFRIWGEYAILFENFVLAEENLKQSHQLNPNNDELYIDLSRLHRSRYTDLGFIDEESLFKNALFLNPISIPARIWYADYLHRNNRRPEAFEIYQTFPKQFSQQFELEVALGKLYISDQKYTEAIDLFVEMKKKYNERLSVLDYNLAISYYISGDTLTAKTIFEEIAMSKSNPDVYLYLAEIAENNGDLDLAIDYLRKRIRDNRGLNDPFKEEARKHLVVLLNKKEELIKEKK
jgi:hypothetical protein